MVSRDESVPEIFDQQGEECPDHDNRGGGRFIEQFAETGIGKNQLGVSDQLRSHGSPSPLFGT